MAPAVSAASASVGRADVDNGVHAERFGDIGVEGGIAPEAIYIDGPNRRGKIVLEAVQTLIPVVVDEHRTVLRCVERVVPVRREFSAMEPYGERVAVLLVADLQHVDPGPLRFLRQPLPRLGEDHLAGPGSMVGQPPSVRFGWVERGVHESFLPAACNTLQL